MALVLHSGSGNKNAFKALIAAEYCGVKVELPKNFEMGVSNKTPEFIKMNPLGKVPVLETPDGAVFESNAIARYVARSKGDNLLWGGSLVEYARVEQWMDFAATEVDLLPPSKMVLDDWKRLYSNTKSNFHDVAVKGFWEMYDPEGYSLWFCDYKYQEENTVSYVTLNKVGGFLQRMDLCRKYAFGKMLVIGSEAPFKVKGLWLFRGQDIPEFVMKEVYDMELYEWTKVDLSDEAQKKRVEAMIEDLEPFEGQALLDAKCFK
ncbi:unnamed protein product [Triticum turgidum subsp. durum]|uniref:Elongation factor 1-gamma n=1 Tax=Triticum turgidum subsp. durum TaxID=4567 RepID=A0A9R1A529_TRITD|nr:unnamed protein product [Triticum turgidum subsp. durum]